MNNETIQDRYDTIVIGAGINGASAARELAAAGYRVLVVDKGDLAAGASSRSSRILHCGLRYFETPTPLRTFGLRPGNLARAVRMARSAMQARAELVQNEPDRCVPVSMHFPVYDHYSFAGWQLDMAFALLRRLGPAEPPLDYQRHTRQLADRVPFFRDLHAPDHIRSVARFREYLMDWPERLCVDTALAAQGHGAELCTFCEATIDQRDPDGFWRVRLHDHQDRAVRTVRARVILNMAGSWIDRVHGHPQHRLVQGTKGAHIVVRLPERYHGSGLMALNRRGEPFYCLPLADDYFYFGPTETPFDGDATDAQATDEDIDALLGEANHLLPGLRLAPRHIEGTWAGVRPLTHDPESGDARRSREIHDLAACDMENVLALTAGPIMTYRSAGRALRARVETILAAPGSGTQPCAPAASSKPSTSSVLSTDAAADTQRQAFRHAVTAEGARDLHGILYTRTGLGWRRPLSRSEVMYTARSVSDLLHWNEDDIESAVDSFLTRQSGVFRPAGTAVARCGHVNMRREGV